MALGGGDAGRIYVGMRFKNADKLDFVLAVAFNCANKQLSRYSKRKHSRCWRCVTVWVAGSCMTVVAPPPHPHTHTR